MTRLEFLSATVGQLIWPILILVLVLLLRAPIKNLISSPDLRRVKAGPAGLELEFERELAKAQDELTGGSDTPSMAIESAEGQVAAEFMDEMRALAAVQPRAVVMESHSRLEKLLRDSVDMPTDDRPGGRYLSMRSLTRAATEQEILAPSEAHVLDELTDLRNRIAHEPDVRLSSELAIRYAELAVQVAVALRLARGKTAADGPPL